MKKLAYLGGALFAITAMCSAAHADQFKLPEEIGRVEAPRDMNMIQIEPTIIHERYYTSGAAERHQFVGNVLPFGAPVPDNDAPVIVDVKPTSGKLPAQAPIQSVPPKTAPAH